MDTFVVTVSRAQLGTPVVTLAAGDGQLTPSWAAVTGVSSYELQWKRSSVTSWAATTGVTTVASTTSGTAITGLTNGEAHDVRVRARTSAGSTTYITPILDKGTRAPSRHSPLPPHHSCTPPLPQSWTSEKPCCDRVVGTLCGLGSRFSSVWIPACVGTTNRVGMTKETPSPGPLIRSWGFSKGRDWGRGGVKRSRRPGPLLALKAALEVVGAVVWEPFERNNSRDLSAPGWAYRIGQADRREVRDADGLFAVVNGCPPDEGVMVELGMAIAWGKPTFLFRDDFRRCIDRESYLLNLMVFSGLPREGREDFRYASVEEISAPGKALMGLAGWGYSPQC